MIIKSSIYVLKVCNSLVECCNTGKLDNSFHDDFRGKTIFISVYTRLQVSIMSNKEKYKSYYCV